MMAAVNYNRQLPRWMPSWLTPDIIQETNLKVWLRLAGPIAVSMAGVFALQFVELSFLGHLSTQALASASIALIWLNVTSAFLWLGFGNALAAVVSQAMGAGNYRLAGTWLQQGLFWAIIFTIPIGVLWWETGAILRGLRFHHDDSELAGVFAKWRVLGLVPTTMMNLLVPFLQAQDILYPGVIVNSCAVGLDIALHAILLKGVGSWNGLGFIGSPIASSITAWLALFVLVWYVFLRKKIHKKTWPGWNFEFMSWSLTKEFLLEQGIPAGVATSLEELQLEAISFMAARLGDAPVSAHNSLLSLLLLMNAFSFGAINATTIRVGHYLGDGNIRMAKAVSWITMTILGGEGLLVGIIFGGARSVIPRIFSNDPDVIREAQHVMLLLALAYMLVSIFFTAIAVLQGQGRPVMIAGSFVLGAWIVGVPTAWAMSHRVHLGLQGLWAGIVIGYVVTTVLALSALYVGDWDKIAVEVADRAKKEKAEEAARHGHGYANPLRAVYDSDGAIVDFRLPSPASGLDSPAPTSRLLSARNVREFELSDISGASPHPFAPKA